MTTETTSTSTLPDLIDLDSLKVYQTLTLSSTHAGDIVTGPHLRTRAIQTIRLTSPIRLTRLPAGYVYYCDGYRLIKSKGTFSTSNLVHSLSAFEIQAAGGAA